RLLETLNRLVDAGQTVLLIEHPLDVIKTAGWVIDLGPEGGHARGEGVATGTPEANPACPGLQTGRFLPGDLRAQARISSITRRGPRVENQRPPALVRAGRVDLIGPRRRRQGR